jgi:DNA topoisomerase-3
MGESNVDLVKEKVALLSKNYPTLFKNVDNNLINSSNKRIFNNSKLEDHHALIPLKPLPQEANKDEQELYNLVMIRFSAAFHANYDYKERLVICKNTDKEVHFKGKEVLNLGWQALYQSNNVNEEEQALPPLNEGDQLIINAINLLSKKTKPPANYNEATILSFMENPKSLIEDNNLKIYGIGTPATRAEIIEGLLRNGYIERKSKNLISTEKGFFLIEQVSKTACKELLNPITTSEWEAKLNTDPLTFKKDIKKLVEVNIMSEMNNQNLEKTAPTKESLGSCPKCGTGNVYEGSKSFYCSRYKEDCNFTVWKEVAKASITKSDVKILLAGKITKPKTMTSKAGKPFTASLELDSEFKVVFKFESDKEA